MNERYSPTLENLFQYITCYSLSGTGLKRGDVLLKFQYITCYSLSSRPAAWGRLLEVVSIHHMLLFIAIHTTPVNVVQSFNTSHVTLYQSGNL